MRTSEPTTHDLHQMVGTTAAEENALTAMVRGCLAASKDSESELNRELGVRGVSSEDKDGQIIVRTSEVEELRKAEAALAGGGLAAQRGTTGLKRRRPRR